MKKIFKRFLDALIVLRARGPINTLKIIINTFRDKEFDSQYKVETNGLEYLKNYTTEQSAIHATAYLPTRARPFLELLKELQPNFGGTFVDYGSGKGRALMLAAQAGFKTIKGIELVLAWAEISRKNLNNKEFKHVQSQVIHGDVLTYDPKTEDTFFYFYDPFDDVILKKCLEKINKSLFENPRPCHVVIHNNIKTDWTVINEEMKGLEQKVFTIKGENFQVYIFNP